MENKPSTSSDQESSFPPENTSEVIPIPLNTESSQPQREKMKYFRKIGDCRENETMRALQKRRYCLQSLISSSWKPNTKVTHSVLKCQKSITVLGLSHKEFKKRFSYLRSLRELKVDGYDDITSNKIKSLAAQISHRLKFLQCFTLKIDGDDDTLSDSETRVIAERIKSLTSLQELNLVFGHRFRMNDTGLKSLAENIGKNQKCLQKLKLIIYNDFGRFGWKRKLTDIGIICLAESIRKISKLLKYLSLTILSEYITHAGIQSLGNNISKLESLQFLNLSFQINSHISLFALGYLARSLDNLKFIEDLGLSILIDCSLDDSFVEALAESIGMSPKFLHHLYLAFPIGFRDFTDTGVKSLAELLKTKLKSLQSFGLSLSCRYENISDIGLQSLAESFGNHLPSLQRLVLFLDRNPGITIAGIESFVKCIRNRPNSIQYFYMQTDFGIPSSLEWSSSKAH